MPAPTASARRGPAAAVYSQPGRRPYQQDHYVTARTELPSATPAVLAAVFDGHGQPDTGHEASQLLSLTFAREFERETRDASYAGAAAAALVPPALEAVVASMERMALDLSRRTHTYHGSTLCAAVVLETLGRLVTANVGDSRAVLAAGALAPGGLKARWQTVDHATTNPVERARIEAAGGWVTEDGLLNGSLGMSRAIGDEDLKEHRNITPFRNRPARCSAPFAPTLLTATPDIKSHPLRPDDHFLLVASDGVWHKVNSQSAVAVVERALLAGRPPAEVLYKTVYDMGAADNITVIVVPLSEEARALMNSAGRRRGDRGSRRQKLRGRFGRGATVSDAHVAAAGAVPSAGVEPTPASRAMRTGRGRGEMPDRLPGAPPTNATSDGAIEEGLRDITGRDGAESPAAMRMASHGPSVSSRVTSRRDRAPRAASFGGVDGRSREVPRPGSGATRPVAANTGLPHGEDSLSNGRQASDVTSQQLGAAAPGGAVHVPGQSAQATIGRRRWRSRFALKFGSDRGDFTVKVAPGGGSLAGLPGADDETVHGAHAYPLNAGSSDGQASGASR